jgi:hypothetical protein
MAVETKINWKRIALIVAAGIVLIWLSGKLQSCGNHSEAIGALYQEVQAIRQAKLNERLLNIKKQEATQVATAAEYQAKLDQQSAAADAQIRALKWKSNEQLTTEKASADDVKVEKKKVEDALDIMTKDRDDLEITAETREKEIAKERTQLKSGDEAAIKAIQEKLDTCEKANNFNLNEGARKTWLSIGPAVLVHIRGGQVVVSYGISIQIPVIIIKSPFKRF